MDFARNLSNRFYQSVGLLWAWVWSLYSISTDPVWFLWSQVCCGLTRRAQHRISISLLDSLMVSPLWTDLGIFQFQRFSRFRPRTRNENTRFDIACNSSRVFFPIRTDEKGINEELSQIYSPFNRDLLCWVWYFVTVDWMTTMLPLVEMGNMFSNQISKPRRCVV